jgi:cyclophilin family peptidyl-prolyl cis-trans isomerase
MLKTLVTLSSILIIILFMTGCAQDEPQNPVVVLETTEGSIELELFPDVAPGHVENFLKLVDEGFYDSVIFHRVSDGFMIQSGDPTGTGRGNSGKLLKDEFNDSLHYPGTLAMAHGPGPNSASSQFYICLDTLHWLDHKFTVFGKTIKGMDVVRAIGKTPTSGDSRRIVNDSAWRAQLMRLKEEEGADVVTFPDGTIMPDRPLKQIKIIRAYEKK